MRFLDLVAFLAAYHSVDFAVAQEASKLPHAFWLSWLIDTLCLAPASMTTVFISHFNLYIQLSPVLPSL